MSIDARSYCVPIIYSRSPVSAGSDPIYKPRIMDSLWFRMLLALPIALAIALPGSGIDDWLIALVARIW